VLVRFPQPLLRRRRRDRFSSRSFCGSSARLCLLWEFVHCAWSVSLRSHMHTSLSQDTGRAVRRVAHENNATYRLSLPTGVLVPLVPLLPPPSLCSRASARRLRKSDRCTRPTVCDLRRSSASWAEEAKRPGGLSDDSAMFA
jgi:hypothetical protein